jgi:hypothetical protein
MERLPNGSLQNAGKTEFSSPPGNPRKAIHGRGYGCIAQLVEQLTLNRQLSQRNQPHRFKMRQNLAVLIQWVRRKSPNASGPLTPYLDPVQCGGG